MKKKQDFLICVDSDGCVMDTMNVKHEKCFGPCLIQEWELEEWSVPILRRWNELNLTSMTRGINRFKGLLTVLTEINALYKPVEDLEALGLWVRTSRSLSEESLKEAAETCPEHPIYKKALQWTRRVNQKIENLSPEERMAFPGAKKALALAGAYGDVAVVSSANQKAVEEEWKAHGLLRYVDFVMAQEAGSKTECMARLKAAGYSDGHILMIGDAPGDEKAAEDNQVLYYPILAGREEESWQEFLEKALDLFIEGRYQGDYQQKKIEEFHQNLQD